MAEVPKDAASAAAAAAANLAVSQTVSAMLDSAATSAAAASATAAASAAAPGMPDEISGLDAGSVTAAGIADTVSSMLESATMAAVAATEDHRHETAVASRQESASAPATASVPPLSPLGPAVENTASGIELSGRRGHGDEEDSEADEIRRKVGATANVADGSTDSRGQLEPVVISNARRIVYNEARTESNCGRVGQEQNETEEKMESKDMKEDATQEEERLELSEGSNDPAADSSRVVDGNGRSTDLLKGPKSTTEDTNERNLEAEGQRGSARIDGKSEEAAREIPTAAPSDRLSAAGATAPRIAYSQLTNGEGHSQQQWQWGDNENPWSRGPRTSTTSDRKPTGRKLSGTEPPPPVYQKTTPPPPYQEVVAGLPSRSSMQKQITEKQEKTPSSKPATSNGRDVRSVSAVSNGASCSSGDDTGRGPPPSYRAAVVGRTASQSSSSGDREEEKLRSTAVHLPPPSYGRFYDDARSTTSPLQGETSSAGARSEGGDWWTPQDQDRQYGPVRSGEDRGKERERGRRRTRASSGSSGGSGGGGRGGLENSGRPETFDDEHEEEWLRFGGTSWHRRQSSEGRRRRTATAAGSSRPRTTTPQSRGKGRKYDTTLSGTESWDDDRWRLTRYLQSCKRELAEAEERRRRAEAAANAAERNAWAAGNSKGGDYDGAKRAWARAATQRVLDLMLVTERVRQEEQKRRVAAARASSQVARCKQPFRERRGRSQKGAFIGPSVPPADVLDPPRTPQRAEAAAMRDIYWDEHGRRYSRRGSTGNGGNDQERTSGEVGVALETVRKVADACLEEGTDFGQPFREIDSDADGRLTLAELGAALRRAGARLSLSQITALFRHFDEGLGLDTVGRGQFLWEFVDTTRLLEQWRTARGAPGGHRARMAPFRSRAKQAGYGGRRGGSEDGILSRQDVLRSLEELGVHLDGWEADALLDRFTVEDGSNNVDWVALVSFMQAAENKADGNSSDNGGNAPGDGIKSAARARRERAAFRTSLPRHSRRHQPHLATGGLNRAGRLFEGGGGGGMTARDRPTRPAEPTTPSAGGKPYYHWASSAPSAARGRRKDDPVGNDSDPPRRPRARGGSAERKRSPLEAAVEGSSAPPSLRSRGPRGRGGGIVTNVAEASRMLDGLLENQQELEAFLEEEIAKREREGGGGGAFSPKQGLV